MDKANMEQAITSDSILQFAGSLGAFVIIIWLYIREKFEGAKAIQNKDEYIKEINNRVLQAFEKNAEVNTQLKTTIEENTRATKSLTQRVTDALIDGNRNHG